MSDSSRKDKATHVPALKTSGARRRSTGTETDHDHDHDHEAQLASHDGMYDLVPEALTEVEQRTIPSMFPSQCEVLQLRGSEVSVRTAKG